MSASETTASCGLVYSAMAAVAADLSRIGIDKSSKNKFDDYLFRGIDAVYNVLSGVLAKHRLLILPRLVERIATERKSAKGGDMVHTVVVVDYDICAVDGSRHTVRGCGEAMDRGDKSLNKAMTSAYKYMAFHTFCIPIAGVMDDADDEQHDLGPARVDPNEYIEGMAAKITAAGDDRDALTALWKQGAQECAGNVNLWNSLKLLFPMKKAA